MNATIGSVEGRDLVCVRGGRCVFRAVNFRALAGEGLIVEGANGAGKSSLLRILAGLLQPLSGSILLRMRTGAVLEAGEERSSFVGWIGEQDGLKPQLSAREHLRFFCRYHGRAWDADDLCARVGLAQIRDVPAQYLSAGQKKRLALARLISTARPLWLLDEPLVSLDDQGKALVREMVAGHCAEGGVAIAATHEPLGLPGTRFVLGRG